MIFELAKKCFVDLHVFSNLSIGSSSVDEIAQMAVELGYSSIGLADFNMNNLRFASSLKEKFSSYGLDLITRVDLHAGSLGELKRLLRFFRRKVEVISVFCDDLQIARLAARDRRVDLLNFDSMGWRENFFDLAEAKLALNGGSALEINLTDFIGKADVGSMIKMLRVLSENVKLARRLGVPIIFSSGARNILEMRAPRDLAAIGSLFNLTEYECRASVSSVPMEIVSRNRAKLSESFILPGVWLVKEGGSNGKVEKK